MHGPRHFAPALLLLSAACAPAWGPAGRTEISLRDPRRVEVVFTSPAGTVVVSPAGAPAGKTYFPESVPWPFAETSCRGARILRAENGAIIVQRLRCATNDDRWSNDKWQGGVLVGSDGRVTLPEPPVREDLHEERAAPFRWEGDLLRWPVTLSRSWTVHVGRSGRTSGSAPVVSMELVTPRDNVVTVERFAGDLP